MRKLLLYLACLAFSNLCDAKAIKGFLFVNPDGNNMEYSIDKYNRINFGLDCFILYSSSDASLTPIQIEYDTHRSMVFINESSGIESIVNDCQNAEIIVDNNHIFVGNVPSPNDFTIVVYSLSGEMIARSRNTVNTSVFLPNTYIVVAYNGRITITKKVIL